MSLKPRFLLGILAWFALAYGVLLVGTLPGEVTHSLCGVWGCFPPVQALASMHALWLLILAVPLGWMLARWPTARLGWAGLLLTAAGLGGLAAVVAWQAWVWLPGLPPEYRQYFLYRILFVVSTLTDVPLVQVTIAGVVCWAVARRRARRARKGPTDSRDSVSSHCPG